MAYHEHTCGLPESVTALWHYTPESRTPGLILPDGAIDLLFPEGEAPFMVGAMTEAKITAMNTSCTGIRLSPGGASALGNRDWSLFTDARIPLKEAGFDFVTPRHALTQLVSGRIDTTVKAASALLANGTPVEQVAKETGYSRRHLERRFKHATGLGPKTFSRIMRFRRALSYRHDALGAVEAGYYDQSHLHREFQRFAGMGPHQLVAFFQDTGA